MTSISFFFPLIGCNECILDIITPLFKFGNTYPSMKIHFNVIWFTVVARQSFNIQDRNHSIVMVNLKLGNNLISKDRNHLIVMVSFMFWFIKFKPLIDCFSWIKCRPIQKSNVSSGFLQKTKTPLKGPIDSSRKDKPRPTHVRARCRSMLACT